MAITNEQREIRRNGIFSSDTPAILGLVPYSNPYHVWNEKVNGSTKVCTSAMSAGNHYEPGNLTWAEAKLGVPVEKSPETIKRIHDGILHGTHLDGRGIIDGRKFVLESKVVFQPYDDVATFGAWGRAGTAQIPFGTECQVQHQMFCAGDDYEVAYVVALRIWSTSPCGKGLGPGLYCVKRDNAVIADILSQSNDFWRKYVITKIAPPMPEKEKAA